MENPTFDFYLTESYELPSGAQIPEIKVEQKPIYENRILKLALDNLEFLRV